MSLARSWHPLRPWPALLAALLLWMALAAAAQAHSLRVFARASGAEVSGYGFFIGGGRPAGAAWQAADAGGQIASGQTGADGSFGFTVAMPVTRAITITLDTREGHVASARLEPARFGTAPVAPAPGVTPPGTAAPDHLEAELARQIAPLLERIEQMDARMRKTDLISGLFLIFGLAGMALWALGRRR